ncbi:hypothetical protein HPB47_015546, partial [Ixodes persulcatus]
MKETTRNRAPNFTEREKDALLDLVEEFKNIVESKTTDKITTKTKNRVWDRITLKFNAVMGARREAHQLKKCYENIKKKARKDLAANRQAVRATGGGPCPTPLSRTTERLTSFIGPLLEPLANCFDSDAVPSEVHEDTQSITTEQYYLPWDPEFEVTNPSSQDSDQQDQTPMTPAPSGSSPVPSGAMPCRQTQPRQGPNRPLKRSSTASEATAIYNR